jgi:hypothetical protein
MKEAMWRVDPTGHYSFSDNTNFSQPTLLNEPNYADLSNRVVNNFQGKTVTVEAVEHFVITETPYLPTHYKRGVLIPLEKASPPRIQVFQRKRAYTYPKGCVIQFRG